MLELTQAMLVPELGYLDIVYEAEITFDPLINNKLLIMKRNRLLICIMTLVSIVSVSSCYEEEGGFKYVDGAGAKGALDLLTENGASISSWTGVEASYTYAPAIYYDLDPEIPGAETLDTDFSFYTYYSYQAKENDSNLNVLEYFRYNDLIDYNYQYYKYIDGENAYIKSQDEVTYLPGEGKGYTLDSYMEYLPYLINDVCIPLFTYYYVNDKHDPEDDHESTAGYLQVSRKGEHKGLLVVSFALEGENEYGKYDESLSIESVFIYDKKGQLESFKYYYIDFYYYEDNSEYLTGIDVSFSKFDKEIDTPSWVG